MPKRDDLTRQAVQYGGHPPYCTCVDCTRRRLTRQGRKRNPAVNVLIYIAAAVIILVVVLLLLR